jgi:hypothetical protein
MVMHERMLTMTKRHKLNDEERHAIAHAEWAVREASPDSPEVIFDYTLVQTLLDLIKSGRGSVGEKTTEKDNGSGREG